MKWIKIIFCLVFMVSCTKMEIEPIPTVKEVDIFTLSESKVINGQEIMFQLKYDGPYIVKLSDKTTNQVFSKEKIYGKNGTNYLKIYTNSLPSQYLYLTIEDTAKATIAKTILTID